MQAAAHLPALNFSSNNGFAAAGVADSKLERPCEDTITLSVQWSNRHSSSTGTAVYTASWIAPKVGEFTPWCCTLCGLVLHSSDGSLNSMRFLSH
jgi:hypothetical protein